MFINENKIAIIILLKFFYNFKEVNYFLKLIN